MPRRLAAAIDAAFRRAPADRPGASDLRRQLEDGARGVPRRRLAIAAACLMAAVAAAIY